MSIENARDFLTRLHEGDENVLGVLPEGLDAEKIGSKEIETVTRAAVAAGWCFAADELREAYLDSLSLDEDELSAVAGGAGQGKGGCSSNYYVEQCLATVEAGSNCYCTDFKSNDRGECVTHGYHKC